jgi:1-acyl-sn-glycerol-3-phosphate acyltransferase
MATPTPPPAWHTALATLTGNLYLVAGSLIMATLSLLFGFLPPRGAWVFAIARLWAAALLKASGIRVRVARDAALDPAGNYLFLPNHQSLFDIPLLLATVPGPVRFLAKRSLFRIPIFGWAMKAGGFIPVDRKERGSARESFQAAVAQLATGTSVVIFPEGTRSLTAELLPFERGGFLMALKSGLPLVPVGIRGGLAIQRRGNFAIRPGVLEIAYGAPIRAEEFGLRRKGELMGEVQRRVAELAGLHWSGAVGERAGGSAETRSDE